MLNGDVEFALRPQNKLATFDRQNNVPSSMSDTQSDTRSVFRVIQNAHPFTTRDEQFGPCEGFSKASELSGDIAGRMTRITLDWAAQKYEQNY